MIDMDKGKKCACVGCGKKNHYKFHWHKRIYYMQIKIISTVKLNKISIHAIL